MMLLVSLSYKKWRNSVYLRPLLGLAFPSSWGESRISKLWREEHVFSRTSRASLPRRFRSSSKQAAARSRALTPSFAQILLPPPLDLLPISFCCILVGWEQGLIRRACNHAHITRRTSRETSRCSSKKLNENLRRNFRSICRGPQVHGIIRAFLASYPLLQQTLVVRGERRSLGEHILRQLLKFPIGNQIDRETWRRHTYAS